MAHALQDRIQAMQRGPRAKWAPPVLAATDLAGHPDVLFIGRELPSDAAAHCNAHGLVVHQARTLATARQLLCAQHYRLLLSEPVVGDADMIDFTVALKAGHSHASGVPRAVRALPVVVFERHDAVLFADDDCTEIPRSALGSRIVALLR